MTQKDLKPLFVPPIEIQNGPIYGSYIIIDSNRKYVGQISGKINADMIVEMVNAYTGLINLIKNFIN